MTHLSIRAATVVAATCVVLASAAAPRAAAQCATCPTPTVAFAPVIAAPVPVVVAPRMGFFDRWRMRRWGLTAPATTVAVAPTFVPTTAPTMVTAGFAPTTWTAGFAPAPTTWTAGFAPVATPTLTAFAPLQRPVAQTAYMVAAPAASCSSCQTVLRPVELSPVAAAPACSACAVAAPCSTCATCATEVSSVQQASFAAPSAGCPSCATSDGNVIYSTPAGEPMTPTPMIPDTAAPVESAYPPNDPGPEFDPTGTSLEAPALLGPANDYTANAPTVDVHTAVYRRPASTARVNTTARPVSRMAVDTGAWTATSGR